MYVGFGKEFYEEKSIGTYHRRLRISRHNDRGVTECTIQVAVGYHSDSITTVRTNGGNAVTKF